MIVRNISGELHTIPYSAIGTVGNLSRDFSNCIVETAIGHDADMSQVMSILQETGDEMLHNAAQSPKVLSPLIIVGVSKLTDTSTNILTLMKTEPDPYHLVDQEFRRRLKLKFAKLHIPVPCIRQVISFQPTEKGANLRVALEGTGK